MDGVSAAGGVISVVSLAIQFADGAKKLYNFIKSMKDTPSDIHDIALVTEGQFQS